MSSVARGGGRPGVILAEALMALLVAALGVGAVVTLARQSTRQDVYGESHAALALSLRGELEGLCSRPWERLAAWADLPGGEVPDSELASTRSGFGARREPAARVTARIVVLEAGLIKVQVKALWTFPGDREREARSIEVERLVSRPDLTFDASFPFAYP